MKSEITYQFSHQALAYRFMNELKHWDLHDVSSKLYKSDNTVKVSYEPNPRAYDYTCSDLDDLASQYDGIEI